MRSLKQLTCASMLLLALVGSPLWAAEAAVLKQVPANALVVVVIPNLKSMSDKVAKIAQTLGVPVPELQNPLESIKGQMGLGEGLDDNGGLAFAMTTLPLDGGEPEFVILAPTKDYAAFTGNFGIKGASPVTVTQGTFQGQPVFVRKSGDYAVMAKTQAAADAYKLPATSSLLASSGVLGGKTIAGSDIMVYIDMAKLSPTLMPLTQLGLMRLKQQMQAMGPQGEQAIAQIDMMNNVLQAILRDAQSIVFGIDASADGFGLTYAAQFKPGSPLAAQFANTPTGEPKFDRLPVKPFLMAMSMNTKALPIKQWMTDLAASLPANDPTAGMMKTSLAAFQNAGDEIQTLMLTPNFGGATGGIFNSIAVYPTAKPKEFIAAQRKIIEDMNNMTLAPDTTARTEYKENVLQVDGFSVDQSRVQIQFPPAVLAQLGPLAALMQQDFGGYSVAIKDAAVIATGADPVSLQETLTAAAGGGKLGEDKGIASVRSKLMEHRVVESYIGMGTILQTVNNLLQVFMPAMVMDVPADMPPIGGSLSVHSGGAAMKMYIPRPILKTLGDAIRKFSGQTPGSPGETGAAPSPAADQGPVAAISDADFDALVLKNPKPVLVEFTAVWASASRSQSPIVAEVAKQYQGKITAVKLDIDKNPQTADLYEVEHIPTLLLFKGGVVVEKFIGPTPKEKLDQAVAQAAR